MPLSLVFIFNLSLLYNEYFRIYTLMDYLDRNTISTSTIFVYYKLNSLTK